jgi:hypothetical protein
LFVWLYFWIFFKKIKLFFWYFWIVLMCWYKNKNIILKYFQVKNTLKNSIYNILKYTLKLEREVVRREKKENDVFPFFPMTSFFFVFFFFSFLFSPSFCQLLLSWSLVFVIFFYYLSPFSFLILFFSPHKFHGFWNLNPLWEIAFFFSFYIYF